MKRLLLEIMYDGTAYHGWQNQPNGITVQEVLESSIERVLGKKTKVVGCSRTDAGVHARQFCCHIDCDCSIPDDAFLRGVNGILPLDIAIISCNQVSSKFHARYDAKGKTYNYNIYNSRAKDPFKLRYSWQITRELDIEKMNEFCKKIVGTHDFYGFSSSGRTVDDTVRTVKECYVKKQGSDITLTITADGFLYNMVRIIVGTAVEISDGRIKLSDIDAVFTQKRRDKAGVTAPPQGLFLDKVIY